MIIDTVMVSPVSAPSCQSRSNPGKTPPIVDQLLAIPNFTAVTSRRKRVEEALLKSEEWLLLAADASGLGLWYWDEEKQVALWDARTRKMFGVSPDGEITLQTFVDALHPDDRERTVRTWRQNLETRQPFEMEMRVLDPDGGVHWIQSRGMGHYHETGKPVCMVGVVFDVTERKQAEQRCAELSGRLINAQEEERRYLARELHDDFSQRLALLANHLERARRMVVETPAAAIACMRELEKDVSDIGLDLHKLSHRLHSSRLEILGLARTIASCCAEFTKKEGIPVEFSHCDVPKSMPSETALCLLRIVQEGLRNVSKHSRATKVEVHLTGNSDEISLFLDDNGGGFEPSDQSLSHGIGIHSMQERARMAGGTFELQSSPAEGTHITVTVPVQKDAGH